MATTLAQVIASARNRHQAFHKRRVSDLVVASYLSDYQSTILSRAADLDASRVAVGCVIAFAVSPSNQPGAVGAGSGGGLPGSLSGQTIDSVGAQAGPAIEVDDDDAAVLLDDTVVTAADTISVTLGGVALPVNSLANQILVTRAGTGSEPQQKRTIISNSATRIVISTGTDNQQFATVPDPTTLVRVIQNLLTADETMSVVTALPPMAKQRGYLVSLDAQGRPYINLTIPLEVLVDIGIPLPSMQRVIGGSVRMTAVSGLAPLSSPLTIRSYQDRYLWGPTYTCWFENDQLFLAGTMEDWANVASIDLRIVPDPSDFQAPSDFVFLPAIGDQLLVAGAAAFMAMRCAGMPDVANLNTQWFEKEKADAETAFFNIFGAHQRMHAKYVREVW